MIISLLVRIICNDVPVVRSIIPPAKDSHRMQDNGECRKEDLVKRSNLVERAPHERFDESIDFRATFDDPEQKEIKSLARKLAKEALESPQLQRNIKKLVNLNGTSYNSEGMKGLSVDRVKSVLEPAISKRKMLNRKGMRKRKKDKRKHRLRRREEHPRLRERNHIKVSRGKTL